LRVLDQPLTRNPDCDVLMHISRMRCRSDKSTEYHYECIHCEAKQVIVENDLGPL
jgi:hypothetical protein